MREIMIGVSVFLLLLAIEGNSQMLTKNADDSQPQAWTGRYLPERVTDPPSLHDAKHGIKMGVSSVSCDDAKTNLTLDWDNSPINYTCYSERFVPSWDTRPMVEYKNIPKLYSALHSCMNESISYNEDIPTFGTHRPLWPRYGEYRFVPRQRWIHNLEHGAIVMLYHPCANPVLVNELKSLVSSCLRRHIITPHTLLTQDRPLALVAWGVRLTMSTVNPNIVTCFIRDNALKGPEQASRDGQFDHALLQPAQLITDIEDTRLCPNMI